MSVPDYRHVPRKLFDTGLYDLKSHDGHHAFTDAVVSTLNGLDPNFRHLKKSAGQTHISRHGEDSVVYLLPDNRALAVDFIVGAGGPNPGPGWGVGEFVYKHSDAHDPDDHGIGAVAPPPPPVQQHEHPGREEMMKAGEWLDAFYRSSQGLQRSLTKDGSPDWEGIGAWLFDVYFISRVNGKTAEQAQAAVVTEIQKTDEWQRRHS